MEEGRHAVDQLHVGAGQRRRRWDRCHRYQRKALLMGEGRVALDQLRGGVGQRRRKLCRYKGS